MPYHVTLKNPYINEKSILGMSSIFCGKKRTYAFLYLPEKKCAICTLIGEKLISTKLSQEAFTAKIENFTKKIKCINVAEVRVPVRLADPLSYDEPSSLTTSVTTLSKKYFKVKKY